MQRSLAESFKEWLNSEKRKSLILRGARQVGKTWFVRDIAAKLGRDLIELNFEENSNLSRCFAGSLEPNKVVENIEVALGRSFSTRSLLFLDEIQSCPQAYVALKFFTDKKPELPVVAAGSHLGILEQMTNVSHPIGYVDGMTLFPMSFIEFVNSMNPHQAITKGLRGDHTRLSDEVHAQLLGLFRDYLFVGGLPECVLSWSQRSSNLSGAEQVRKIQTQLLKLYKSDFSKYHGRDALGLTTTWEAVARQLHMAQDVSASRFKFKGVLSGKKEFSQFSNHFQHLEAAGLIYRCPVVDNGVYPLKTHVKDAIFKAYYFDTGILLCELDYSYQNIIENDDIGYKGFLSENYVIDQFKQAGHALYCYRTKSSEIEFLLQTATSVIPIEVKNNSLKAKSLASFVTKYASPQAFKVSCHPYFKKGSLENFPLYRLPIS